MMGQDGVQQAVAQTLGKALNAFDRRLDDQRTLDDVVDESALVGDVQNRAQRIRRGLSHVVEYRRRGEQFAMDLGVLIGNERGIGPAPSAMHQDVYVSETTQEGLAHSWHFGAFGNVGGKDLDLTSRRPQLLGDLPAVFLVRGKTIEGYGSATSRESAQDHRAEVTGTFA